MLIEDLCSFYNLLASEEIPKIPTRFFSNVEIKYELVINENGELIDILEHISEKNRGIKTLVPEQSGRTATGIPYFMCDNSQYIFGCSRVKDKYIIDKNEIKSFESSVKLHNEILKEAVGIKAHAILNFFNNWDINKTCEHPVIKKYENEKNSVLDKVNLTFRLENTANALHNDEEIKSLWISYCDKKGIDGAFGICGVSGEYSKIARIHPSVKGLGTVGGKSLASMVTYNCDSFKSYNKENGQNAPISEKIAFEYTTMLNELISNKKYNLRMSEDTLAVFWASSVDEKCNDFFSTFINGDDEKIKGEAVDPVIISEINSYLENAKNGLHSDYELNTKFNILALSPNSSRISIRYYYSGTFGEVCKNIKQHYEDISIINTFDENEHKKMLSLWRLLNKTKRDIKPGADSNEKINPQIPGNMLKSIMQGTAYPQVIFNLMLGRIKAGDTVTRERASMIKGFINRKNRINNKEEELKMSLNEDSTNVSYVLGRLFSVLEKAQLKSMNYPKDVKTIKDTYFTSACTTPAVVFPRLLKLSQFHMAKFESGKNYFEKEIGDLLSKLQQTNFPKQLSLEEQGTFIIGYYHQSSKKFEKVEKNEDIIA